MTTKFHVAEVPGINGRIMYRGSISDAQGRILDQTRLYYNRKNARAAAIALKHELDKPQHPALAWNVDVELHPDGYFCAVDLDVVDSVGEDGRYPAGYGRTPLAAIVELLDEMGGVT